MVHSSLWNSSVNRTASDAVAGALPASISGSEHRTGKRVRAPGVQNRRRLGNRSRWEDVGSGRIGQSTERYTSPPTLGATSQGVKRYNITRGLDSRPTESLNSPALPFIYTLYSA